MTLIGDFNWDGLVSVNRLMAQILVGTYFALTGVVCLNLYIALLSDTFSRVYAQAQANAVMQQAQLVLMVEKSLPKKKKIKFGHYMKDECGPLVSLNYLPLIKTKILFGLIPFLRTKVLYIMKITIIFKNPRVTTRKTFNIPYLLLSQ